MIDRRRLLFGAGANASLALAGCGPGDAAVAPASSLRASARAARLVGFARRQVGLTTRYDGGYSRIAFPGGDVPRGRGVCTDVVIRAYRDAFGLDLQALVNADMRAAFAAYPRTWGLAHPDANIDHRRVPNLATWLRRHHGALAVPSDPRAWQPGDIFTSLVAGTGTHIGLVSDRAGRRGPMIIHNIGAGAREEDALLDWPITGRFRWAVG
ncbi:MAG: hypothetical protein JWO25_3820 [Alphaproteobacteria bacterium]|nr:hypothetical protein [Alphaproteobacteria bacterium]